MIYVECRPDTTMARVLSGGVEVDHLHGKSRVCNKLMGESNSKGMIDEDEGSQTHPYIKELKVVSSVIEIKNNGIIVYKDNNRSNILILLKPRLEEWIIQTTNLAGINMGSYQLPSNAEELHLALSIGDRENQTRFRMLVQKLVNCSERVEALIELLR